MIAALLFAPIGPLDNHHLPNGGFSDPAQMTWFLAFLAHSLVHWQNFLQTNLVDYPTGINLATNTSVPLLGLIGTPITELVGPVATFNFILRLSLGLSATSLYFVLARFGVARWARFVGGLIYGFGPYLVGQSEGNAHLDLSFGALVPVLFLLLYEMVREQPKRPLVLGALFGLVASAQFYVSPEVLAQVLLIGALGVVVAALVRAKAAIARIGQVATSAVAALWGFAVLCCYPVYELLAGPERVPGPVQPISNLQFFSEDLVEPFVPIPRELVAPGGATTLAHFASKNVSELGGYLGAPLVLLVVILVVLRRRDPIIRCCAGLGVAAFILALGERLVVRGHRTTFRLPEAIFPHVPFLKNVVPARFGLEVALFTAAIVAIALSRVFATRPPPAVRAGLLLLLGLSLVALAPRVPISEGSFPWPPSLSTTLSRAIPRGAVVLSYPYPAPPNNEAMIWQAEQGLDFFVLGGYATVPNEQGDGQLYPQLLLPKAVQAFLGRATEGAASHYPPSPTPNSAQLCQYVRNNRIDDVVFWARGAEPSVVGQLFRATFGSPVESSDGVSVFRTTGCGRPALPADG